MKFRSHPLVLALALAAFAAPAPAMFMRPEEAPVDRLLKNAEAYLAAHPDSAEARYTVARIHYLAFARRAATVPAFEDRDPKAKGLPELAPNWMINPVRAKDLDAAKLSAHAQAALDGFRGLVGKEPGNGLYQLGLASLLEQVSEWREREKPAGLPDTLKAVTAAQARDAYLAAFRASIGKDSKLPEQPISGLGSLVSHEAAQAFLRLSKQAKETSAAHQQAVKEVAGGLARLEAMPPCGAITPIVFSLSPVAGVDELLAPDLLVDFNLRGYGPDQRIPWIRPGTALLVWDPAKRGEITSGRQLFGGYTFQIFRDTGYDALAALDDDGNGILEGAELGGIRAWFDANGDAVSSRAEVRDLADLGIVGLRVDATGHEGPHPTSRDGLLLRDGTTLPTWDWMVRPQTKP